MGIYIRRDPPRYWLVVSYREGERVVQKRLKYLGTEPPSQEQVDRLRDEFKDRLPPPKRRGRKPKEGK